MYLNNIILSWPEDGRLTAETCRQVKPSCNNIWTLHVLCIDGTNIIYVTYHLITGTLFYLTTHIITSLRHFCVMEGSTLAHHYSNMLSARVHVFYFTVLQLILDLYTQCEEGHVNVFFQLAGTHHI